MPKAHYTAVVAPTDGKPATRKASTKKTRKSRAQNELTQLDALLLGRFELLERRTIFLAIAAPIVFLLLVLPGAYGVIIESVFCFEQAISHRVQNSD